MTDLDETEDGLESEGECAECGNESSGGSCESCGSSLCSHCGFSDEKGMNGRICEDCHQSFTCVHCDTEVNPPNYPQCKARPGEECEDFR